MKILVMLPICFVVALSDHKETTVTAAALVVLALIPSGTATSFNLPGDYNDEEDNNKVVTTTVKNVVIEDDESKLEEFYKECIDKTKVKVQLVDKFKEGSWNEHKSLSKWALCVLVKLNLMSPQGVYRYDTALTKYSYKNKLDKILDHCLTWKPLPPYEIAWKYLKCLGKIPFSKLYF